MTVLTGAAAPPAAGWRPRLWARAVRGTWISHRGAMIALVGATVLLAVLIAVPATWANAADPKAAVACVGQPVGAPCAASYLPPHTAGDAPVLGFAHLTPLLIAVYPLREHADAGPNDLVRGFIHQCPANGIATQVQTKCVTHRILNFLPDLSRPGRA
jgi:hypothetical protein